MAMLELASSDQASGGVDIEGCMGLACIVVLRDIHVLHRPIFVCHVTQIVCPADPAAKIC